MKTLTDVDPEQGYGRSLSLSSSPTEQLVRAKPPSRASNYGEANMRVVHINNASRNAPYRFCSNHVKTSKYDWWNFIPKNLFEQFRRVANVYFLIISIIQMSTTLSPTNPYATFVPLCAVILITMVKEGFEDWKRHKADRLVNNSRAKVLHGKDFVSIPWKSITVGSLVLVEDKEEFPADLIFLSSSEEEGLCYIETSNLDGESNLKIRNALPATNKTPREALSTLHGELRSEGPNNRLYNFDGTLILEGQQSALPVDFKNVALRGSRLRNTKSIIGLVVFTGRDTKLMQNARATPSKRSNVEKTVNFLILLVFFTLFIMCTVSTILGYFWVRDNQSAWYLVDLLPFRTGEGQMPMATTWITFMILYNNLVPISLYVSLELVKFYQAQLIASDLQMYHAETDSPALARTSNLNEDLGQIQYIFSDKTGTLTRNEMDFRKCSIGGLKYVVESGSGEASISLPNLPPRNLSNEQLKSSRTPPTVVVQSDLTAKDDFDSQIPQAQVAVINTASDQSFGGADAGLPSSVESLLLPIGVVEGSPPNLKHHLEDTLHPNNPLMKEFFLCIALCHSIIPDRDKEDPSRVNYQAASPDEAALVIAAANYGYKFTHRTTRTVTVNVMGEDTVFEILNVNEFNSNRKRMSVIVRCPNGKIVVYCKGADSVMLSLLLGSEDVHGTSRQQHLISITETHLSEFGTEGLRTLLLAKREIDEASYEEWSSIYYTASTSLVQREEELDKAAEMIEVNMELLGATAIEDKLQDGVPDTIASLLQAGIKIWVLTGDKQETAINIGYASRLLTSTMQQWIFNEDSIDGAQSKLNELLDECRDFEDTDVDQLALIIDGKSLAFIFEDKTMQAKLFALTKLCKAVVACRVSPLQKAQLVRLVNDHMWPRPMTLAIGDGGNDVSMIQEAHVGIGVIGKEGMQAVRASDYSIGQFRFLKRLLLVHGRWNYKRISKVILYCFYKNIALVLTLFYFSFFNTNSGTTLYDSWLGAAWNVLFTFFPIIFIGILDQDLSAQTVELNPALYMPGQWNLDFNVRQMVYWVWNAIVHSVVVFFLAYGIFQLDMPFSDGAQGGLFFWGTTVNFCLMCTVNLKVAVETHYWTIYNHIATWGSILVWFLFVAVYSTSAKISSSFYHVGTRLLSTPSFWLTAFLVPFTAVLFDIAVKHIHTTYFPTPLEILEEIERGHASAAEDGELGGKKKRRRRRQRSFLAEQLLPRRELHYVKGLPPHKSGPNVVQRWLEWTGFL